MKLVRIPFLAASLFFAAVPAGNAWSSPYPQADAYYTVRDKAASVENLILNFTPQQVQTQPAMFAGKVLEVKGVINAIAGTDVRATVLVDMGGQTVPVYLPPDRPLSKWTTLDVGVAVRFLCHVMTPEGSTSGELQVAIAVREPEAAALDLARSKAEAEKKAKDEIRQAAALRASNKSTPKKLASRGVSRSVTSRPRSATAIKSRGTYSNEQMVGIYAGAVKYFNRRIEDATARHIAQSIISYSVRYGLDARLVMAVIAVESNFNPGAVSPVGAMGLGQLMPGTAGDLGVNNAFSIQGNLEGSTRLLSSHIRNMSADGRPTDEAIKLALACYNAGAGAVRKYKGIPPYRETQNYVVKITRLYRQLCGYSSQ